MKTTITFALLLLQATLLQLHAQMRVHLINVGQGCATLVEFPCGALLVDTGGETNTFINSSDNLKSYLEDFFARRTDLNNTLACVYLTHPHKDHTQGVAMLLEPPFIIKNAVTDGLERGSGKPGQVKLHRLAQARDENTNPDDNIGFEAVTTDEIGSDGFTNAAIDPINCLGVDPSIKVLWGTSVEKPVGWSNTSFANENNHSLVLKIEYGTSTLLITGDLEDTALSTVVAKYNGNSLLDSDIYVVGHHGSKNGTTTELLDKVTPKMALIGVGDSGREIGWSAWAHGHPNKGILDLLQRKVSSTRPTVHVRAGNGAKTFADYTVTKAIYATAWDGNVVLEADASGHWTRIVDAIAPTGTVTALINVNTATAAELENLPGIGPATANAIITYRTAHGNFANVEALDNVSGIGPATINLVRAYVMF